VGSGVGPGVAAAEDFDVEDGALTGSEGAGEILDGDGLDCRLEQVVEAGLILSRFDGLAKSYWDLAETDLQGFQDSILLGMDDAFLAELLCECHGGILQFGFGD